MPDGATIGHNRPPETTYAEQMMEESAEHRARTDELVKSIGDQTVGSLEDAARVTALANLATVQKKAMDDRRKVLKTPHDEAAADVQRAFQPWINDLSEAIDRARKMIDDWNAQQVATAQAVQREADRMAEEERRRAQDLETTAQEMKARGDIGGGIRAELDAMQAQERAARLAEAPAVAERLGAGQIRTQLGGATQSTRREAVIVDVNKFTRWMIKHQKTRFLEVMQPIVSSLVRSKVVPEGVEVREVTKTRFFR